MPIVWEWIYRSKLIHTFYSFPENKEYPRGIFFEGGGHFIFNSHPEIVAQSIIDLVRHLKHSR